MCYSEFHLSSEGEQRSAISTRSHPIFELNETIIPSSFNLKQLSLPLSWCNLTGGEAIVRVNFAQEDPEDPDATSIWYITIPDGCYKLPALATEIQKQLNELTAADIAGDSNDVDWVGVVVTATDELRLEITIPTGFAVGDKKITITWMGGLEKIANRLWYNNEVLVVLHSTTSVEKTQSLYPWRMVPNFVYLHSNIMSGVKYGRHLRVQGGFKSNTILAKIPIDPGYIYGEQVMPYVNVADPVFMFANDSAFSHLEFWFTDETTETELDFQNLSFSFTLAMTF